MNEFTVGQQAQGSASLESLITFLIVAAIVIVAIFVLIYVVRRSVEAKRKRDIFLKNRSFSKLVLNVSQNITGSDFEVWVQQLLVSMGITAKVVGGRGDHGIDVTAEYLGKKICIQCKKYYMSRNTLMVGEPVLRDLYGAMHAGGFDKAVAITTGQFTREALLWAEGKPELVLINAKLLERIILNRDVLRELLK